jgi:hypothetical protein
MLILETQDHLRRVFLLAQTRVILVPALNILTDCIICLHLARPTVLKRFGSTGCPFMKK